ncbi:hypothetical protein GCM10023149_19960 [Mucilaginibacter gynuensis]|uniref:Uncharacterized protein n=1 Tax=Mucilaginibacter gynuensis TaxID=1302236 RepID=A0ABP8GAC0_9SPHI
MKTLQQKIRKNIIIVIAGLAISGITAFPLESELSWLTSVTTWAPIFMQDWLHTIYNAIKTTNQQYPYLSYGTDWLAFAHLVLALLFVGTLKYPVRNIWVIQFGMLACVLIFPLAFIVGNIRGIPFFWQLIDCSFGVIGIIPLYLAYKQAKQLERYYLEKGLSVAKI